MKQENYTATGLQALTSENLSVSDLLHYCSTWTWRAVDALSQAQDFRTEPKWIANRLNITEDAARDAVEGLLRVGILRETPEGYKSWETPGMVSGNQLDRSDLHQIHTKLRAQIADKMSSRDAYSNLIVLSTKSEVNEFYGKFLSLLEEFNQKSLANSSSSEVFALELSIARLSREQK